jgi:glycosyltransferase involved in cell wall biosynthesis
MTNRTAQSRPKVLIAAGNGHITEVEMIKGLRERGVDIHAAFASTSPHLKDLAAAGVPVRTLDLETNVDLRSALKVRRWIKREQFKLVHGLANRQVANFIWASYGLPNKVIAYRGAIGHVSRWDPTCYLKWLNPRIDKIICVSKAVEQDLTNAGVNPARLTTIYKGHNLAWYNGIDRKATRRLINHQFDIPPQSLLIGMAANMRHVKGADLLLNALKLLPTHVHALLIGEVRDPRLVAIAQDSLIKDRVHFAGYRTDAKELIGGLDVNCAPSRGREGLTKAILEGMAQGVPSIVSDAGGLPELVEDGESGFVVPNGNAIALSKAIRTLTQDQNLVSLMGSKGSQIFQNKFNINETIEATACLYHQLNK